MKRYLTLSAICILASVFMAPMASAQCPLSTFVGTWGYHAEAISFVPPNIQGFFYAASAGRFAASVATDRAGNSYGLLTTVDTTSKTGEILRLEQGSGKFQLNPDCSGGTIVFTGTSSGLANFDFYFVNGGTEIYMVGTDVGTIKTGTAKKI